MAVQALEEGIFGACMGRIFIITHFTYLRSSLGPRRRFKHSANWAGVGRQADCEGCSGWSSGNGISKLFWVVNSVPVGNGASRCKEPCCIAMLSNRELK